MKVISKRITKDELISRKNGLIPWLTNKWIIPSNLFSTCDNGELSFSAYSTAVQEINSLGASSSILEYESEFTYDKNHSNYGFIVSDIILPQDVASKITDYTDFYVNIPDGNGGYYDLNDHFSCVRYNGRKIISGGTFIDANGNTLCTCFSGDCDEEKLRMAVDLTGGTEVKILTYATLNKWYTFFKEYYEKIKPFNRAIDYYNNRYENKNDENKKRFTDLDALFDSRGGSTMYNWIIRYCMPHDDNRTPDSGIKNCATNSASYVIPILLTNSIDDLGEMAIFSSKWESGVDYHNRVESSNCDRNFKNSYRPQLETFVDCNGNTDDQCFGTIVDRPFKNYSGDIITEYEAYLKKSGSEPGYKQNDFYENEFVESAWTNYTDWYICNNRREFASYDVNSVVSGYAYSPVDGRVIYNPSSTDDEIIPYTKKDFILVNGESIQVIISGECVTPNYPTEYVIQKQNNKIPVITDGSIKYAELNGKRFYAVYIGNNKYKIYFFDKCIDSEGSLVSGFSYVLYNNSLYEKNEDGTVTINDASGEEKTYNVLNGYFTYNGATYTISGNRVIGMDNAIVNNNGTVTIKHNLDVKKANVITGYTESKLELLRRTKVNTDELGNDLPGYIDFPIVISAGTKASAETSHYNTAYDGCELDLLYKVGQFSDIEYQKNVGGINYFNGNYLESIEFYCLDDDLNKINCTKIFTDPEDGIQKVRFTKEEEITEKCSKVAEWIKVDFSGSTKEFIKPYFEGGNRYIPGLPVYCDITYYIGATLENIVEKNSDDVITKNEYALINGRHKGVKYVDTLIVNRAVGTFYMSDKSAFGFTYYELLGNMSAEYLCDYRDVRLTNMSYFEMEIMTFFNNNRSSGDSLFNTDYWERNNGMIMSPVFRPEYYLFTSTKQNDNDDIYIDRGISAAFENHLKLLETHSMEALENYGNGYFKISEY